MQTSLHLGLEGETVVKILRGAIAHVAATKAACDPL